MCTGVCAYLTRMYALPPAKPKHRPSDRQTDRQADAQGHGVGIPGYVSRPVFRHTYSSSYRHARFPISTRARFRKKISMSEVSSRPIRTIDSKDCEG